ncbi:MAG: alpha-ribazole phosphatase [Sporomusaceae bacterium]|nr:alpha-ribazole phosphatase [Sporomusaceae bacterium]
MTKVIFVRHGETLWNHSKRYQGHSDIPLNEKGIQQAKKVAQRLAGQRISAVYSSDLIRAVQTAEVIANKHSLQAVPLAELREVNFGLWEGLTYEEIMADWPEVLSALYLRPGSTLIPEGESFYDVQRRTAIGLSKCIANHHEETIVIVSHGGAMRILLCDALGLTIENMWSLQQDSTAINMIDYFMDSKVVSLVNCTYHLNDLD